MTTAITTELVEAVSKTLQTIYDILPLSQKIIFSVKENAYALTSCGLPRPSSAVRTYSAADAGTATFGAAALLVSPEYYGQDFVIEVNPKSEPKGTFKLFHKDSDEGSDAIYHLNTKGDPKAEKAFYAKAIYTAAAVAYSETGSMAFVGYLIVDDQESKDFINISPHPAKNIIAADPSKGEEIALNMAKEALRRAGKNISEFTIFRHSCRGQYTRHEDRKELDFLYSRLY